MNILWITNIIFPKLATQLQLKNSASGTWLIDLAERIAEDREVELSIMSYYGGEKLVDMRIDGIRYLLFPGGSKRLLYENPKTAVDCRTALNLVQPDIIHIHGTEYAPGYEMLKLNVDIPVILTIQGIITRISQEYFGGLSVWTMIGMSSLKELLTFKAPVYKRILYLKNAKREQKVIRMVRYVTGRTDWDKATLLSMNPSLTYYRCNYNLPAPFYESEKWSVSNMERHTIVTGASLYSLKGLHILIQALAIVKKEYPDVKLYIPGGNAKNGRIINPSSYVRYINKMISKFGLENNVVFRGKISSAQVAESLLRANVCVIPSAIEGASASLREAMMIGTPSICAYRGGMTDLLHDGRNGYTYDFSEVCVLAMRIGELFANDELATKFSKEAIKDAEIRHDRLKNPNDMIAVYKEVLRNEGKSKN